MNKRSIRSKFAFVIFAVFIVATLLLVATLSGVTSRIINDFALRVATKEALNDKIKIMSVLDREVVLAQKMADDNVLKKWFVSADNPELKSMALEQLESYRLLYSDKSYFVAMDSTLRYYVANKTALPTMVLLKKDNPADKWYFESIKTVDNFALNLDYNATIHKVKFWINAVMKDSQGNKIGIVGSGIDITDFLQTIVHNNEKGITTVLFDRQGIIQAHKNQTIVEKNALERDETKKSNIYEVLGNGSSVEKLKLAMQNLSSKKENVSSFLLDISGKKSVAALSFLPQIGWYNIVLVDVSNVLGFGDFLPIILVSILTLLVVILVIGFQLNSMVLSPLTMLNSASEQMAAGNYSIALPVQQDDEIGLLTKSFNLMAATVLQHTEHLEENVQNRTVQLTQTNALLEKSQQRITESIEYASVIQASILPDKDSFESTFAEWFTLYQPCDIVGGDFYWLRVTDGRILLAVIDCTGHGVPGAFMTMTVNSVLNQVVDTFGADDPARILNEMNRGLQKTLRLRQDGDSLIDAGLDIALCSIDQTKHMLVYAGTGISLYIEANGALKEIKGDKQRIGYRASKLDFTYTNHTLNIENGTKYYVASDGFFDEGGDGTGFCFGNERFEKMLIQHANIPLFKQGEQFEKILSEWRGRRKQRDDITMVGFSF